jgi:hypothetical protein
MTPHGAVMSDAISILSSSFAQACTQHPEQVRMQSFTVGGASVHTHVVGTELASIFERSLADGAASQGGLTLELWDEASTGIPLPALPEPIDLIRRGGPAGEWLEMSPDGHFLRFWGPDFEIRMNRSTQHAVGWVRSEASLSSWHRARPLQTLFIPWIADRNAAVVHAAMVAKNRAGVLLAGPSHSGKSTLIAACGSKGFDVMGDDTIALETSNGSVLGHCLHAAVKLRRAGLHRHPDLEGKVQDSQAPWQDEKVGFLKELFPGHVVATAELVAIGFPALGDSPSTTFAPLSSGHALRRLTGCMLSVEPGRVVPVFDTISEVINRVPAFEIAVGTETSRIPDGLDALLDQLAP